MAAGLAANERRRPVLRRAWLQLGVIVATGAVVSGLLAIPMRRPRIFGDELIYWELSRGFAWTGHFTVRGGLAPRYGVVYPALLAIAQRLGGDQSRAYVIAQGLNAVMFSLAALPTYAIASRVLTRRYALLAALLAVFVPSCVLTSAIMTESAFYPLFLTTVLLMLRALERPSLGRQMAVIALCAVVFLTRAQAVVLLPFYLLAMLLLALTARRGLRVATLKDTVRRHAPTIAFVALAGIAAATIRGRTTLGPYHVLVSSYSLRSFAHWGLANLADMDLYLGVVPLAAFALVLVAALSSARLTEELRALALLTGCLGLGLLTTVAALGASPYGLGRTHERNIFYVAPLVLICFFAWLEAGLPRPRIAATAAAVAVALLPLAIPVAAVATASGEDGLALVLWEDTHLRPSLAIYGMALAATIAAALFLWLRSAAALIGVCVVTFATTLVAGELHAADSLSAGRGQWQDGGWIDRAAGPDARVVALWATSHSGLQYARLGGAWADEFYNRSVHDVASADGPLPDGLPVTPLTIHSDGCLAATFPITPQYAVVETNRPLAAPVVAVSPSGRTILYRLDNNIHNRRCFTRLRTRG